MKKFRKLTALLMLLGVMFVVSVPAFAAEEDAVVTTEAAAEDSASSSVAGKALGAGICVGIAAGLGALGMGMATGRSSEAMARQPEIRGELRTNLILGIVFMETAIIYALVIAVLIIFVL